MRFSANSGRIIGISLLSQLIGGILVNFFLLRLWRAVNWHWRFG